MFQVSLKRKKNIRTYKHDCIIHRAERSLLNEKIRNINNTLERLDQDRYMYELKLSAIIGQDLMKECMGLIEDLGETRHKKILEQQRSKFERLWHKNSMAAIAGKI